jgi:DNA-binding MurR/RpiR family transcriptional regulator
MAVPAMLHDGVGKLDHRFALRPGDAVLAITFAPYSEETLTLAADAHARGLPVIGLTDTLTSPLARLADAVVTVPEVDFGAFRSLSATIALAISLAVAVGAPWTVHPRIASATAVQRRSRSVALTPTVGPEGPAIARHASCHDSTSAKPHTPAHCCQ